MQVSKQEDGIKKVFGKITVDKVSEGRKKNAHQAQIRQIISVVYPGVRSNNSLNDKLFSGSEFGVEAKSFEERRVCFLPIPIGTTAEEVQARLDALPNARIAKILSLNPILSKEQENAMKTGLSKNEDGSLKTIDDYRESQSIRNEQGEKVYYQGHEQYRQTIFQDGSLGPVEDVDLRADDLSDFNPIHMSESALAAVTTYGAKTEF